MFVDQNTSKCSDNLVVQLSGWFYAISKQTIARIFCNLKQPYIHILGGYVHDVYFYLI